MADSIQHRKDRFLNLLQLNIGIVSLAVQEEATDVTIQEHALWIKEDSNYRDRVKELDSLKLDFTEAQLLKIMKSGNVQAITQYLEANGRHRGYGKAISPNISSYDDIIDIREALAFSIRNGNGIYQILKTYDSKPVKFKEAFKKDKSFRLEMMNAEAQISIDSTKYQKPCNAIPMWASIPKSKHNSSQYLKQIKIYGNLGDASIVFGITKETLEKRVNSNKYLQFELKNLG